MVDCQHADSLPSGEPGAALLALGPVALYQELPHRAGALDGRRPISLSRDRVAERHTARMGPHPFAARAVTDFYWHTEIITPLCSGVLEFGYGGGDSEIAARPVSKLIRKFELDYWSGSLVKVGVQQYGQFVLLFGHAASAAKQDSSGYRGHTARTEERRDRPPPHCDVDGEAQATPRPED